MIGLPITLAHSRAGLFPWKIQVRVTSASSFGRQSLL
jgi:hypothetical protein